MIDLEKIRLQMEHTRTDIQFCMSEYKPGEYIEPMI